MYQNFGRGDVMKYDVYLSQQKQQNVCYLLTREELNGVFDIIGHVTTMKYNKS